MAASRDRVARTVRDDRAVRFGQDGVDRVLHAKDAGAIEVAVGHEAQDRVGARAGVIRQEDGPVVEDAGVQSPSLLPRDLDSLRNQVVLAVRVPQLPQSVF